MRKRIRRTLIVVGVMYALMLVLILLFTPLRAASAAETCADEAGSETYAICLELAASDRTDRVALDDITDLVSEDPGTFAFRLFCCCAVIGTISLIASDN